MCINKFYYVLNVNNDTLIATCLAPEGLLTDYMNLGYRRDYIEDYRLTHKETIRDCERIKDHITIRD